MSERKTSEIKFRCTPSFKASLAAAAQAADKSMSEYLESAVWALENRALGQDLHKTKGVVFDASTGDVIRVVADESIPVGEVRVCPGYGGCKSCPEPEVCQSLRERGLHESGLREFPSNESGLREFLSNRELMRRDDIADAAAPTCEVCKPWEFCSHKAGA